jgi:small GTP-binding protein
MTSKYLKIVIIGDASVGKTTLFKKIESYQNDLNKANYRFERYYQATDGFKLGYLEFDFNGKIYHIDFWDTAGQENNLGWDLQSYLKGSDGIIVMYDIDNRKTIENLSIWSKKIKMVCDNVPIAVIGNKCDKMYSTSLIDTVKLRDTNIKRDFGSKAKNFLISIKENYYLKENSTFMWLGSSWKEEKDCLIGINYILSHLLNKEFNLDDHIGI